MAAMEDADSANLSQVLAASMLPVWSLLSTDLQLPLVLAAELMVHWLMVAIDAAGIGSNFMVIQLVAALKATVSMLWSNIEIFF